MGLIQDRRIYPMCRNILQHDLTLVLFVVVLLNICNYRWNPEDTGICKEVEKQDFKLISDLCLMAPHKPFCLTD